MNDDELLAELERATEGLLFMSESDYPFETFRREATDELNPQLLRELAGESESAPVREQSVEDFFRVAASEPAWKGEAELATARRYQKLVKLLKDNLAGVKAHRVGDINIQVFVVGRSKSGSLLGLTTRVVET